MIQDSIYYIQHKNFHLIKFLFILIGFSGCTHKNHLEKGVVLSELPIEILKEEEDSGRIFATGKIDNNSVRFYIDTGSSSTKIKTNDVFDRFSSKGRGTWSFC